MQDSRAATGLAAYRAELHGWLDAHLAELAPRYSPPGTLDDHIAQMQRVKKVLFDAGWMQHGWPERVGGRGGSPMLRTELGAAIAGRDLVDPGLFSLIEVLAPTLIDFAPEGLAAEFVPRLLSGDEIWCQGFSEPESGSDLASLRCRAAPAGDGREAWVINGQKVWTSLAQYSDRCVLLTRTGPADSKHRGITAFFIDMDTPGITVAPLEMINGEREFAEVFFDDVMVPADRMLGELDHGWAVAMSILPYERSSCFWQRIAYLYRRLQKLVEVAPADDRTAEAVGNAFLQLHALRARSRATQHRLAAGGTLGAETSIDKVLVATAEQTTYDAVRRVLSGIVEMDDSAAGELWRSEYLYSRAATIYGGTLEVQRNIIARRLLELGERRMIDATERAAMEESVRGAIAGADGHAAVDEVLRKLGWLELLAAETADAIEIVFVALGVNNRAATALDDVLASALGHPPRADLAVLLPAFAAWDPPGRIDGNDLHARGLATARAATAGELLVVCGTAAEPRAVRVPMREAEVRAVRGVDPEGGLHEVRLQARATASTPLDPDAWPSALALGRRAVAHQISGASRAMLALARSHALERVQFERPIAGFQAVRHRLADALVAAESLDATLAAARDEPGPETGALAKAAAGRTARTVAAHCQQVLAGIGFTAEHPFHRFLKRTMALEGLFGSADEIVLDLGRRLLAARRVPTLIEL